VRVHVAATDASKKRGKDVPQKIGRDDAAEILQQMQKSILVEESNLENKPIARPPGL
jgi:hypothetical protein